MGRTGEEVKRYSVLQDSPMVRLNFPFGLVSWTGSAIDGFWVLERTIDHQYKPDFGQSRVLDVLLGHWEP